MSGFSGLLLLQIRFLLRIMQIFTAVKATNLDKNGWEARDARTTLKRVASKLDPSTGFVIICRGKKPLCGEITEFLIISSITHLRKGGFWKNLAEIELRGREEIFWSRCCFVYNFLKSKQQSTRIFLGRLQTSLKTATWRAEIRLRAKQSFCLRCFVYVCKFTCKCRKPPRVDFSHFEVSNFEAILGAVHFQFY